MVTAITDFYETIYTRSQYVRLCIVHELSPTTVYCRAYAGAQRDYKYDGAYLKAELKKIIHEKDSD